MDLDFFKKLGNSPIIIAGPCSVESEKQLLLTAKELKSNKNVKVFRAGVWKVRTKPNCFEGVGDIGLEWLKTVKNETGLLTATEVITSSHVEKALKKDIDVVWIGARTTANPVYVQQIVDVLKGNKKIILLVKNPVCPEIGLWKGAVERIQTAGIKNIILVHRGFSCYRKTKYRNSPLWKISSEMKRLYPDIWQICDPSHISGNKEYILEIAKKAFKLKMNGLMVETHIAPDNALSDKEQQLTPQELLMTLNKIKEFNRKEQ